MFTKQKYTLSILVILSIYLINNKTYAKSIYAITSHLGYEVSAYKIDGSELIYQIDEQFPVYDTFGAVGLALDPNSEVLFVSYDANSSKALALINAKTMGLIETKQMDYEFGGLAFDTSYQKLYAVQKLDNLKRVHIYSWDDQTNMLVDDDNVKYLYEVTGTDPYYCIFGIALDDSDGILYVSDGTNKIYMYDTNSNINDPNWSYEGYFEIKAGENEREAVGIDVYNDGQGTRYLYAGSWPHEESHKHLTRTNIDDPNDCIEVLVGESPDTAKDVAGVTVDDETGLIYVTTFHQDIRVYDPNLILLHIEETLVGNPADIVLAGDVQYKPPTIFLDKSDNVDPNGCVSPGDIITYTLVYGPAGLEQQNVWLTDFLPEEVDLLYTDPNYTYYDPSTRTVSWYLGDLDPDDPNTCVYLWVEVNESAPPTGTILNPCEIESDTSYNIAEEMTPVCCWSEILYVDQSTAGYQNGTSWLHAFNELYDALDLAKSGCGTEIRVAEGSYVPRLVQDEYQNWYYEPFQMANGVPVYGGFPTGGGDWDERDPLNNETILGGNGQTEYELPKVVTFESCNENTILDGFIITDSYSNSEDAYGVYIENGSPTVTHNRIMGHEEYGVYIDGGSPLIARNRIDHNDAFGIYIEGTTAAVTHNYIHDNGYGLFADYNSTPHVTNNMIYRNDQTGIYLNNSPSDTILRNNTIAYNQGDGVVKWGGAADPNIVMINCIVWKNDGEQVLYCPAKYSCIYDSVNDPNGVNPDTDENGNITTNPLFYSLEDDDFHLDPNSPCIDTGDPEGDYEDEKDIDGHNRLLDGGNELRVDMGADEFCGGADTNYADFNDDGFVDLFDYAELANAWLTEPPGMNPIYDLNTDEIVSLVDLSLFTDEWLWMACWQPQSTTMMSQGGGSETMQSQSEITAPEVVELTAEQLVELIEVLKKMWETDEEFRKEVGEEAWEKSLKLLYEELERLYRQSETKK